MMSQAFSLTWDSYKNSLSSGLSSLQQNGEFVDMTLAADGHFVKVHQIVIALASPYMKELISSIQCTHPVLFLNKISYITLSQVLEYIYTGEVMVEIENLNDFLEATRELRIKGLENMKLHETLEAQKFSNNESVVEESADHIDDDVYFEIPETQSNDDTHSTSINDNVRCNISRKSYKDIKYLQESNADDTSEGLKEESDDNYVRRRKVDRPKATNADTNPRPVMQYTVSNQGSLQMILNRFVYYLKHTNQNNSRQWRCVDYVSTIKCPAYVVTKNDVVLNRISAHTHTYHDAKILKKVRRGAVFGAIQDAQRMGNEVTSNRAQQSGKNVANKQANTEEDMSVEFCSVPED